MTKEDSTSQSMEKHVTPSSIVPKMCTKSPQKVHKIYTRLLWGEAFMTYRRSHRAIEGSMESLLWLLILEAKVHGLAFDL